MINKLFSVVLLPEFLPVGLLTPIAKDLNISAGQAGWTVMLPGLIAALAAPLLMLFSRNLILGGVLALLAGLSIFISQPRLTSVTQQE
jgi:predicted MFS family arabinose efflux permease